MAILLTNDDGVDAPGLAALAEALAGLDELYIAAPAENRSGVGMGITIGRDLTARRRRDWPGVAARTSIDGTPADAVKYGVQHLLKMNRPRLVVSGINHGANLGRNVRCSGTVGAAFEAFVEGIPAIAASVDHTEPPYWAGAQHYVRLVAERALALAGTRHVFMLNLNVPALPPDEIKGFRIARHGSGGYQDFLAGAGRPGVYSMSGAWIEPDAGAECDGAALSRGYAVLTPMRYEMTDAGLLERLNRDWSDLTARA